MSFKPIPLPRAFLGFLAAGILLLFAVALSWGSLALPFGGLAFILAISAMAALAASLYALYRTLIPLTLRYHVSRDGVIVTWLLSQYVIPIRHIREIVLGADDQGPGAWWTWPSRYVARLEGGSYGHVVSLATRPLPEQILLVTSDGVLGLSPADPEEFVSALQERYRLGPARLLTPGLQPPWIVRWPLWRDRLAVGLLFIGAMGVVLLFGWLSFTYAGLPEQVPLHFDAHGIADRIGPRSGLFVLPIISLLAWVVNGVWGGLVYARQRVAAYLLWGGALVVQLLTGMALVNLT
ncbi:MAG TPA: DUF1648 domain-containing protein [Caldilineae bacterium]|jgi:hypothetical protein|nr:DUF1648 domain-containing protein [Caldilineae bacterium]